MSVNYQTPENLCKNAEVAHDVLRYTVSGIILVLDSVNNGTSRALIADGCNPRRITAYQSNVEDYIAQIANRDLGGFDTRIVQGNINKFETRRVAGAIIDSCASKVDTIAPALQKLTWCALPGAVISVTTISRDTKSYIRIQQILRYFQRANRNPHLDKVYSYKSRNLVDELTGERRDSSSVLTITFSLDSDSTKSATIMEFCRATCKFIPYSGVRKYKSSLAEIARECHPVVRKRTREREESTSKRARKD